MLSKPNKYSASSGSYVQSLTKKKRKEYLANEKGLFCFEYSPETVVVSPDAVVVLPDAVVELCTEEVVLVVGALVLFRTKKRLIKI